MIVEPADFLCRHKTMIKIVLTITLLFSPLLGMASNIQKIAAKEIIENIPPGDLRALEIFFSNLMLHRNFAYTLFGDKPVSIGCYDLENEEKPDVFRTSCLGYRTWEKYAHLLPGGNYVFLFYEDPFEEMCELSLINKKAFRQIVNEHKEAFADLFGSEITSEKLLSLLIEKRSLWNTPMKIRDDLIGILLGFGKTNALLFQKRSEILRINTKIKKKRTTPSQGYDSIDQELEHLNTSLKSFSNEGRFSLNYVRLPAFVADPREEETVQLKKKYTEQRKWITEHLSKGNLLEMVFEQLSIPDPCGVQ